MRAQNKTLLALVIILAGIIVGMVYWQKKGNETTYHAVYLDTGDLYFGELHWFPKPYLKNVWLVQRSETNAEGALNIGQFQKIFWGPEDTLYLEKKHIVWTVALQSRSQVMEIIKNGSPGTQ